MLITSATSRNGTEAAKLLLAQGQRTLRLATRDVSKLPPLAAQSAESIAQARAGVNMVYLIFPTLVGDTETVMFRNFLQALTVK